MKWPVGCAEELACDDDEVGLAGADDLIGLSGLGDHAYGGGGDRGFAADGLGVVNLVAGADGDLLGGVVGTGGNVDEVDAFGLEELCEFNGLGEIPGGAEGFGCPVGGGDADEDGEMLRPGGADGADGFEREADAVFERAAVVVGAVIGEGREELVEEVAVGAVDFDEIEAGGEGTVGSCSEVGDDPVHAGAVEGGGCGVVLVERDGGGGYGLPASFGGRDEAGLLPGSGHGGFTSGVGELGAGIHAVFVEEGGDVTELGDVFVFPDSEVGGGDAGFGADGIGFGDDEGCAADGAAREMDEVPVVSEAVVRGVLAHGGDGDAVGEDEAAKLQRGEEVVR